MKWDWNQFGTLVSLIMLILGFLIAFKGFHAFDIAHHDLVREYDVNLELLKQTSKTQFSFYQITLDGSSSTTTMTYLSGLRSLIVGFIISVISALSLGLELSEGWFNGLSG